MSTVDREDLAREALGILMSHGIAVRLPLWRPCLARAARCRLSAERLAHLYLLSLTFRVGSTRRK